jgi:hypothetical protein
MGENLTLALVALVALIRAHAHHPTTSFAQLVVQLVVQGIISLASLDLRTMS